MTVEDFRDYCLSKEGAEESFPFDDSTLVFKVGGKIFAFAGLFPFNNILLKCDPDMAVELREHYVEVTPGYHMNKKHWNGISTVGLLSDEFIMGQIDNSYNLVVKKIKIINYMPK